MSKKIIIIIIVLGAALTIALGVLFFISNRGDTASIAEEDSAGTTTSLPTVTTSTSSGDAFPQLSLPEISRLSEVEMLPGSLTLSADGEKILFFNPELGDFYSIKINGSELTRISEKSFYGVSAVGWSPKKNVVALAFERSGAEAQRGTYVYDLLTKNITKLSIKLSQVCFGPTGAQIAYWYADDENRAYNISVADATGANYTRVANKYLKNGGLEWHWGNNKIYFWDRPVAGLLSSILSVDPASQALGTVLSEKYSLLPTFSSKGSYVFASYATDITSAPVATGIFGLGGQLAQATTFRTLADKAAWNSADTALYVGVPQTIPTGFDIGNYLTETTTTHDSLWVYNLKAQEKTLLLRPDSFGEAVDIRDPILSLDEKLLFFRNALNQNLYAINLEKVETTAAYDPSAVPSAATGGAATTGGTDTGTNPLSPEERLFGDL